LDGSLGGSGGRSGRGDGFNGNGHLAMSGGLDRVTRRGPTRMRKIGVDHNIGGFKAITNLFSDNHPPLTFTCNHHSHPPDHAHQHAAQPDPTGPQPKDDMVANTPSNPLSSTKGTHFIASLGLRMK